MASKDGVVNSGSFDEFNTQLQGSALKTTRNSMLLPADISYHRSMDSEFSREIDLFSSRVLSLTNKLLTLAGTAHPTGKGKGRLEDEDDIVDNFHSFVVDSMDQLLERTDICLDDFLGRNKAPAIAINPKTPAPAKKKPNGSKGQLDPAIQHASHLPKPQVSFKTKVDNSGTPWRPRLTHKYNAQVPLGYQYHDSEDERSHDSVLKLHPYRYEITHTTYPSHMFEQSTPISPQPFDSTTFKWVSTSAELNSMVDELRRAQEIAVDLEHHSYRSYAGFLCLMQISTREQDWIIDLLALREETEVLNEVFTDPKIVKVFHGAESDIVWLQQDLNLYIVNLFDTYHASKVLGFPRHGLANLLEMYCDFTPDKRYQLADWRIRPLPEEMLDYARSDTHFLLYIYDNLRNALIDRAQSLSVSEDSGMIASTSKSDPLHALIREVLARSEETALRVYEKEIYDAENGTGSSGWDTLARKWNKANLYNSASTAGIPGMQREVYRRVHMWRDQVAREEDESTRYVLPNQFIFQLAEQPPAEMAALLRVFHSVPPVIRRRAKELLDTIRQAVRDQLQGDSQPPVVARETREEPVVLPEIKEVVMSESTNKGVLWSDRSSATKLASSTSSLFRPVATAPARNPLSTTASTLFGKHAPVISRRDQFSEVVSRIHRTLVIAPSASKVATTSTNIVTEASTTTNDDLDNDEGVLPAAVQPEVPFVPSSQRIPNETMEDDSIVIVGQTKQKKRKRAKAAEANGEPSTESDTRRKKRVKSPAPDGTDAVPQEAFDFDSVPNVLDEPPAAEDPRPKKRGKAKAKEKSFYGNFPAPPKAHSELRSANKSHTFK
ncbi:exosome nuclease subunit [Marasmius crinis-equi]|uniref:Exosome nuclease subunit n=1 Tax=Marasmius crinis-equi TaxID=585013 RepID=A0ABR3FSW4_9AGAR